MAKVTGPLLSMDASGSVAGAMVFAKWKGRPYVRQLVIPSNPKSGAQVGVRAMMKFLSQSWAGLSSMIKATWETQAAAITASTFNAFVKDNMASWGSFLAPTQEYPATGAGPTLNLVDFNATGGVRSATLDFEADADAGGWGLAIYRSTVMGFTPTRNECIAVVSLASAATGEYLDTPLSPDTYYYRAQQFNTEGKFGDLFAEQAATVS